MINEKKWKKKTQKNLYGIVDLSYKEHVIEKIMSWVDDPDQTPEKTALQIATIERLLLEPLETWLSTQKKENTMTDAAISFSLVLADIIWGLKSYGLDDSDFKKLDKAWTAFLIYADSGGFDHGVNQREKAKKPREKVIKNIIYRAYRQLPDGTAKEIWPILFPLLEEEFCESVVKPSGNKKQPLTWKYLWKDEFSNSKSLTFRNFQNKLTKIKKEKKI